MAELDPETQLYIERQIQEKLDKTKNNLFAIIGVIAALLSIVGFFWWKSIH